MTRPLSDARAGAGIAQHADALDLRRDLLEQLEPFAGQVVFELRESGDVAARPRQADDMPAPTGSMVWAKTIGMVRVTSCSVPVELPMPPSRTSGA